MDFNPFDQFASDMGSALPQQKQGNAAPEPSLGQPAFDFAPKANNKPVMNNPMNGQLQFDNNNTNNPYMPMPMGGAGPPIPMGTPQYQQQQQPWGGAPSSVMAPPSQQPNPFAGALVPSAMPSNPYALGPPSVDPFNGANTRSMAAHPPQPGPTNPWDMSPNSAAPAPWGPPPPSPAARPLSMPAPGGMSSSASFQAPTPPAIQQPPLGGGDFGDFFGSGQPAPPSQRAPTPLQHQSSTTNVSMVPGVPPTNVQGLPQQQHFDAGRPHLNQRDMSLSNVFGVIPDAGSRPQMNTREASLTDVFGAPSAPRPQMNSKDASLSNIFASGAPPPASETGDAFGGVFDSNPTAVTPADPWGSAAGSGSLAQTSTALVVSSAVDDDPFGIFGAPTPTSTEPPKSVAAAVRPVPTTTFGESANPYSGHVGVEHQIVAPSPAPRQGGLPPGGEFYDAKIFTPTLGVMFFKPQELLDSLFLQTDRDLVNALEERPVVAFIVEGSSARSAGVELGHVLLKVNGIDVKTPKDASRLIKEGPRPLPLLFYVPDTTIVVAEGEHMVKYDTKETVAPVSSKDWKPKYVVVGGIIAQNWMLNMYRSKAEYDIAVIETQARRPVSVKVKQFSLQGARIQNDWQGPQMVKYKNKLHPWKYFVVLPVARNPIKISSPNLTSLKPVHEGIRRVLASSQRGAGPNTAAPIPRPVPPAAGSPSRNQYSDQQDSSSRPGNVSNANYYSQAPGSTNNYGPPVADSNNYSGGPFSQPPQPSSIAAPAGRGYAQPPNGVSNPYGQPQQGGPSPINEGGGVSGQRSGYHPEYRF